MPRFQKAGRRLVIESAAVCRLDAAARLWMERQQAAVQVFYFHRTPRQHAERFRLQVEWLREHFEVIDFQEFARRFTNPGESMRRPAALLTFDDGYASNYEVAAPILERVGVRGTFFVVPQFSTAAPGDAERFYRDRIRECQSFEPAMSAQQIRDLAARGHTIGNHTLTHAWLSRVPEADLHREIVDSASTIEDWIGAPVEAFAWPFQWDAITPAAHRIACTRHRYCFSPCAGRMDMRRDVPHLIWRTNLESHHDARQFRFQASGLAGPFSAARRRFLSRSLKSVRPSGVLLSPSA